MSFGANRRRNDIRSSVQAVLPFEFDAARTLATVVESDIGVSGVETACDIGTATALVLVLSKSLQVEFFEFSPGIAGDLPASFECGPEARAPGASR